MTTLIRGLQNLPNDWADCAVTIGKFDGLHLGHQLLLKALHRVAAGLPTVMMNFIPNPEKFFQRDKSFMSILNLRDQMRELLQYQIDYLLLLPFNQSMRELSAEDFLLLLKEKVCAKKIVVGEDFCFGYQRQGTVQLLKQFASQNDIEVVAPTLLTAADDQLISSSRIRALLQAGQLDKVTAILGRQYSISGKVVMGDQIGRTIGFPTANIHLKTMLPALHGIFAVKVFRGKTFVANGAASIGTRPTVSGSKLLLEVYLFVDEIDCYGEYLTVEFIKKIRDEEKFDSLEALQKQIAADVRVVKRLLD